MVRRYCMYTLYIECLGWAWSPFRTLSDGLLWGNYLKICVLKVKAEIFHKQGVKVKYENKTSTLLFSNHPPAPKLIKA